MIKYFEGWDYFNWIAQHLDTELLFDKEYLKEERRYNSEK